MYLFQTLEENIVFKFPTKHLCWGEAEGFN